MGLKPVLKHLWHSENYYKQTESGGELCSCSQNLEAIETIIRDKSDKPG